MAADAGSCVVFLPENFYVVSTTFYLLVAKDKYAKLASLVPIMARRGWHVKNSTFVLLQRIWNIHRMGTGGNTMKITVTEHELLIILEALKSQRTLIAMHLAAKLNAQDPADDGPEVAILSVDA